MQTPSRNASRASGAWGREHSPPPQYGCFPETLPFAVQDLIIPSTPDGTHKAPVTPSIWPGSRSALLHREIGHVRDKNTWLLPGFSMESSLSLKHVSIANVKPSAKHENGGSLDHIPLNDAPPIKLCHMLT